MLRDITFGQFYQTDSPLHRLDPRLKIVFLITQIVFVFVAGNFVSLSIVLALMLLEIAFSKVPVKLYLKNLKAILPILIFTLIFNLFYGTGDNILFHFWIITVTTESIIRSVYLLLRILILIISGSVLSYTTSPNDLTDAIEKLFSPLSFIGLKSAVHTLAMMMTIAIRFIPTLVEETEKIIFAQKARGADFENGGFKDKINSLIPILIPLLISSVRRAYELAEAMECRCYNGCEGRVRMKQFKLKRIDLFSALFVIVMSAGVVLSNIFLNNIIWGI